MMIKSKVFLILSLCTIFSAFGAQEQVSETKHLRLAYVLPRYGEGGERADWSADSSRIRTSPREGCSSAPIKIWDAKTGNLLTAINHSMWAAGGFSWARGFSPDWQYLISSCGDRLKIVNTATGACVREVIGLHDKVLGVWWYGIWSPDGNHVVIPELTQSSNCIPRRVLYHMQTGEMCELDSSFDLFGRGNLFISWRPDSCYFVTHNAEKVFAWSIHEKLPIRTFEHKEVRHYYWADHGNLLITESYNEANVWNFATGELVRTFDLLLDDIRMDRFHFRHTQVCGRDKLFVASISGVLRLYDLCTGMCNIFGDHLDVWITSSSPDGNYAVTMGNEIKLWDLKGGKFIIDFHSTFVDCDGAGCALSNDYFAIAAQDGMSFQLWNVHTKKLVQEIQSPTGVIEWSPDGKRLLTQSYPEGIKVWNLV